MNTLRRMLGFGCAHPKITFPIGEKGDSKTGKKPLAICQECFQRVPYDWENMRVAK